MATKEKHLKKTGTGIISWLVFLVSLTVVAITLTSVIFPTFLLGSISGIKFPVEINIFETGLWTYPVLTANIIVFCLALLYVKKKLPIQITKAIRFIFNFEVSKRLTIFVIVGIIALYIGFSIEEVFADDPWIDYTRYVQPKIDSWTPTTFSGRATDTYLTFALGKASGILFGEYAVSAFIASIALLLLTYLLVLEISKRRFAGLVAMFVLLQSGNFLIYDTTITYPNFWTVFLLLSLYFVYKKWPLSPISFLLSIPTKVMSALYLPMIAFFIFRANISKRKKIYLGITYGVIVIGALSAVFIADIGLLSITTANINFNPLKFLSGFTAFTLQFRFDGLIMMFLLPLTVGLFIASRNGIKDADSVLVLMAGILLLAAILPGFTAFTNNPYRFMPFVVFFAVGVGTLLSRRS